MPNDPAPIGEQTYFQVVYNDPAGPAGFSLSRGLMVAVLAEGS